MKLKKLTQRQEISQLQSVVVDAVVTIQNLANEVGRLQKRVSELESNCSNNCKNKNDE
jgi:uncharacterized coiled-coil protein SlyX